MSMNERGRLQFVIVTLLVVLGLTCSVAAQKDPGLSVLTAAYPLNDDVTDRISENHGTLYGGAYVDGQGLVIGDNMQDYCGLPDMVLNHARDFSIKIRFQLTDFQESANTVIHCLNLDSNSPASQFEMLARPNSDKIDVHFLDFSGQIDGDLATGLWYEIEVIRFQGELSVYLNNLLELGPSPVSAAPLQVSASTLFGHFIPGICIGQDIDTSSGPFDPNQSLAGEIDFIRVSRFDAYLSITNAKKHFSLRAGPGNESRNYLLLASASGTTPGFPLPGGHARLPLNWDMLTDAVLVHMNSPLFDQFMGTLDNTATKEATLDATGVVRPHFVGTEIHFAYCLNGSFDYASNAVGLKIVP